MVTFPCTLAIRWAEMSDDAAALRTLWSFARETARGDMERMANSDQTHRKITLVEAVAMEGPEGRRSSPTFREDPMEQHSSWAS